MSDRGLVLANGFEQAFLGLMSRVGEEDVACYDLEAVLASYQRDGMTRDEAVEFFEVNVLGAWVGPRTPCFLTKMTLEEARDA
jgi:hypothetical protein